MAKTQSIIDRITFVTKDYDRVRWTLSEISHWLNDAQDQIASLHPRAASQYVTLTLREGSRQDLRLIDPSVRWIRLFELTCNYRPTDVNVPTGTTIRQIARPALDNAFSGWRGRAATALAVDEFAMDEREAFTFDVNPPVQNGVRVYALAAIKPEPCAVLNSGGTALIDPDEEFGLHDGYDIPAVDYTLFRLFNKDANDPTYSARAAAHLQAFQLAMGVETRDASPA